MPERGDTLMGPQAFGKRYAALSILALALAPAAAHSQSIEDFYRGKTVNVVLGYPGTGSNGLYARTVAQHIGKHIPGRPSVILRQMPGAGSLVAANHLANVAPRDGTSLGLIAATI